MPYPSSTTWAFVPDQPNPLTPASGGLSERVGLGVGVAVAGLRGGAHARTPLLRMLHRRSGHSQHRSGAIVRPCVGGVCILGAHGES